MPVAGETAARVLGSRGAPAMPHAMDVAFSHGLAPSQGDPETARHPNVARRPPAAAGAPASSVQLAPVDALPRSGRARGRGLFVDRLALRGHVRFPDQG